MFSSETFHGFIQSDLLSHSSAFDGNTHNFGSIFKILDYKVPRQGSFIIYFRILKDSYFDVAKEIFSHLHISFERLKQTWINLGHGNSLILEGMDSLKIFKNVELRDSVLSSGNLLIWKKPRKLESFGSSRRMSFEMIQASSLKHQVCISSRCSQFSI